MKSSKSLGIEVVGSTKEERVSVKKAILFINRKDRALALRLRKRMRAIIVHSKKKGYENSLFPNERVFVCQLGTVLEASVPYLASLFIHEERHLQQRAGKKKYTPTSAEQDAYRYQRKFLARFGLEGEAEWLDYLYKEKWWWYKDKKSGKKKYGSPQGAIFSRLVQRYLDGAFVKSE